MTMTIQQALTIVLELARQNMVDPEDNQEEADKQEDACSLVEDYLSNL